MGTAVKSQDAGWKLDPDTEIAFGYSGASNTDSNGSTSTSNGRIDAALNFSYTTKNSKLFKKFGFETGGFFTKDKATNTLGETVETTTDRIRLKAEVFYPKFVSFLGTDLQPFSALSYSNSSTAAAQYALDTGLKGKRKLSDDFVLNYTVALSYDGDQKKLAITGEAGVTWNLSEKNRVKVYAKQPGINEYVYGAKHTTDFGENFALESKVEHEVFGDLNTGGSESSLVLFSLKKIF